MLQLRYIYVGLPLVAAATLIFLGYLAWQRREAPGAVAFVYLALSLTIWSIGAALEVASTTLSTAVFWSKFKYFGVVTMPPTWLAFTLQYTGRGHWLTRRNLALLTIHPVLTLLLLWTTETHGLFWSSYRMDTTGAFPVFSATKNIAFWLHTAYSYALAVAGAAIFLRQAWRSFHLYRMQVGLLVLGCLVPLASNALTLAGFVPLPGLDLTPVTFTFASAGALYALLGFRMLDIVPIARDIVIENMTDGVIVLDAENRVIDLNAATRQLLDPAMGDVIGKPAQVVFAAYADLLARYRSTLEMNAEVALEREGQQHYLDLRISPIRDRRGIFQGRLIVWRDITHRKHAEQALSNSIMQLAMLRRADEDLNRKLDLQYVLAIALDFALRSSDADTGFIGLMEGDMLRVAHLFGNYSDVAVGTYLPPDRGVVGRVMRNQQAELITTRSAEPDFVPRVEGVCAQICVPLLSQERFVGVLSLQTSKPDHFTPQMFDFLILVGSRIASAMDNAYLYQVSQNQLTELQALYARVSHLERLKTDMINIAAHDLRNPIGIVSNYALMLREEAGDLLTEQQKSFLDVIEQAARRILKITGDILSLERIEQTAATMQPVELCQLVEDVFSLHQEQARYKSLRYELVLSPDAAPTVNGDPAQLREAMSNLIVNAIKYTPVGGRVSVRLSQVTFRARFEVEDTGYGIPANLQANVFQPFFRAETEETHKIEGSGLGLHLVKNIVERHHGQMLFHSEYGQGSTFGFELTLSKRP
jgi:PAS domain S-box-containing protein